MKFHVASREVAFQIWPFRRGGGGHGIIVPINSLNIFLARYAHFVFMNLTLIFS